MNQQFMPEEQTPTAVSGESAEQAAYTETEAESASETAVDTAEHSAELEKLAAEIRPYSRSGSRSKKITLIIASSTAAVSLVVAVLESIIDKPDRYGKLVPYALGSLLLILALFFTILLAIAIVFAKNAVRKRKAMYKSIANIDKDDVRMIGPLAEALEFVGVPTRVPAKTNLTRLMPHLKANDSALLNGRQRRLLDRFLTPHMYNYGNRDLRELWLKRAPQRDIDFQLAILAAYEQVGDADSLPAVKSLAYPPSYLAKSVPAEVTEAARHCLLFLEVVAELDRSSKQLLRASSGSDMMPNTLLRPAMGQTEEEQANSLLRAAGTGDAPSATEMNA